MADNVAVSAYELPTDIFELQARGLLRKIDMAEAEQQVGQYGELRGQVQGLERNVQALTSRFDRGFEQLENLVRDIAKGTDARFEEQAKAQLRAVEGRSGNYTANMLAIFGMVIAGASLAVTLYTLTKEPIENRLRGLEKQADASAANFVPTKQIEASEHEVARRLESLEVRQFAVVKDITSLQTASAAIAQDFHITQSDVKSLAATTTPKERHEQLQLEVNAAATKDQFNDLRGIVSTLGNRIQGVYDRAYSVQNQGPR